MALYFGWIATCDVVYMLGDAWNADVDWDNWQDMAGLPTFLLGSAFLGCVVLAATRRSRSRPTTARIRYDELIRAFFQTGFGGNTLALLKRLAGSYFVLTFINLSRFSA